MADLAIAAAAADPGRLDRIVSTLLSGGVQVAAAESAPDRLLLSAGGCDGFVVGLELDAPTTVPLLRTLCEAATPVTVVAPSISPPVVIRRALDAGVAGLVLEQDLERGLLPTLLSASAGQISVPRAAGPQVQVAAFTPRERQVVHMAALGFKNSEIGQKLFLAESTVKSHLSSAFAKLGVRSRSEAAAVLLDGSPGHELLGVGFDT